MSSNFALLRHTALPSFRGSQSIATSNIFLELSTFATHKKLMDTY
jgi:hypothetical protein